MSPFLLPDPAWPNDPLPDPVVAVTLEHDRPLKAGEWRVVDADGTELGRARVGEPITVRCPSSTPIFAEYPR